MKITVARFLCLSVISSVTTYGRAVKYWYPDDLMAKSTLVCDGLVLDVTPQMHEEWRKNNGEIEPVRVYSAQIKVTSVIKGERVDTVEMRYGLMETDEIVFDGPCEINLIKGNKYRFYLKKDANQKCYWGCLQGELDDAQSVGPILVPDSAEDAKLRVGEMDRDWQQIERTFTTPMRLEGKPGYEASRDALVSKILELVLICESLKKADTDQNQIKLREDSFISKLARRKDLLFPNPSDTIEFDKIINDNLPDAMIRAYVVKHLVMEWDKYPGR